MDRRAGMLRWTLLILTTQFIHAYGDSSEASVNEALKGLNKRSRFARGLQDQCVDVYEDLEQRARKAGQDFLRFRITVAWSKNNWRLKN